MSRKVLHDVLQRAGLGRWATAVRGAFQRLAFKDSASYWQQRYSAGGDSGTGSYGRLAHFKADWLSRFVETNGVSSVVELGCGDGAVLSLARYPRYIGLDVAPEAIKRCSERFRGDETKSFFAYDTTVSWDGLKLLRSDLALSLDVVFHLVERQVFESYMAELFRISSRWVIVYSSDHDEGLPGLPHVRRRRFTDWVEHHQKGFELVEVVPNPYPFDPRDPDQTTRSSFYVYRRVEKAEVGRICCATRPREE